MDKVVLSIIAIFFVISGFDYINNNKLGLGEKFKEGMGAMGAIAISMVGIYSFSPLIGEVIGRLLTPIGELIGIDSAIFPSMFLAIDMGALGIAENISSNIEMYWISGVIIASTLGATISFSIPLALGIIDDKYIKDLSTGLLYGIMTIPVAPFLAGIFLGVNIKVLFINMLPLLIFVGILVYGMIKFKGKTINVFAKLGKVIQVVSIVGLLILGFCEIIGIESIGLILPIDEGLSVVGKIAIFLGGAYPLINLITIKFSKSLSKIGNKINLDEYSIAAFLGTLASNIILFQSFDKMKSRGRIALTAFSVSGAFVIGGQLGFVSLKTPEIINIYILTKLISGFSALLLALFLNKESKDLIDNENEININLVK
ncbi:ethanolamine utilization protein EutH [Clostridium sp. B9]|uniref:ethanolamine utilization protein EutH n=1 Tax=Clostridium sp. B9 TaxID=3423224 RepID=UPI003D2F2296